MVKFHKLAGLIIVSLLVSSCGADPMIVPAARTLARTPTYTSSPAPTRTPPTTPANTPTSQVDSLEIWVRPVDGMRMVAVPGGAFQMGSTESEVEDAIALCREHYPICNRWYYERESPLYKVSLDGFWLDQTEISNAHYRLCVGAGVCPQPTACQKGTSTFDDPDKDDHPVVCVSWEEAQSYCGWAGARLPTEAEWEYAFRGGAGSIYPWGDEFDGSRLNYCDQNCSQPHSDERFDDGYPRTASVGSYPQGASWAGILDMGGNVSEWVADWLGEYSLEAQSNPTGPETGSEKMLKGCSWYSPPAYCRGAARPSVDPDTRFDYLGFRCAASADLQITPDSIDVPLGDPPTIDGIHSPGEWDGAAVESFADGSQLFLLQAGDYLYLGIKVVDPGTIAGNVFINQGDEIAILHTSAALGTAIYQRGEDDWEQVQDFVWRSRSTSSSQAAQAERAAFLEDEGWLAANGLMGKPDELEYKILIPEGDFRLAAVYIKSTYPYEKVPWPAHLDDDSVRPTPGEIPKTLNFSPDQWVAVQLTR